MNNSDYFNKLLSNQCPQCDHYNNIYTFWFELHCINVEIVAKKISEYNEEKGFAEYEVISFKLKEGI
jgi:hypothetical protein